MTRLEDGVDRKIADGLKKGLSLIFNRIDQVIESKVNQKVEEHVKEQIDIQFRRLAMESLSTNIGKGTFKTAGPGPGFS